MGDTVVNPIAVEELRGRHPQLTYESYQITPGTDEVVVRFRFVLEPDITFEPELRIPRSREIPSELLENLVFHVGLVEAISYWKAACPARLRVLAGPLSVAQQAWWRDLFIHGLGEFLYTNDIDFNQPDFLTIEAVPDQRSTAAASRGVETRGDLVLAGGGKDSAVTLELVKDISTHRSALILNPIASALAAVAVAEYPPPLVVGRTIDPRLLELNSRGYLNGHTPFSAYLAFLSVLVAHLNGFRNVVVSNERSAGEENLIFHGLSVNHQYSKGLRFEGLFRQYCADYLTESVEYFSFLRPLYDLRITQLFAGYRRHHPVFRSCNVGQRRGTWCGSCAKCAYVYGSLFPFIGRAAAIEVFGADWLERDAIVDFLRATAGHEDHKPFECVGTHEEARLALALSAATYRREQRPLPVALARAERDLQLTGIDVMPLEQDILKSWSDDHHLPTTHSRHLRRAHDRSSPGD